MEKAQDDRRYFGKYRGIVKDARDPKKLGRLRCQVPEVFGPDLLTDWAWPVLPYGGFADNGHFFVPEVESGVFVEFESGNVDRPLWTGCWWSEPEGEAETPKLAREERDETTEPPKGTDLAVTADFQTIREPESPYGARYPRNKVIKTKSGIVIELDDTDGKERLHFWHPTGTYEEIAPDGAVRRRVQAKRFLVVELDDDIHVKGTRNVVVDGNATLHVAGDYVVLVEGNKRETILGNLEQTVLGDKTVTVMGNHSETAGQAISEVSGQANTRTAGGNIVDTAPAIHHN